MGSSVSHHSHQHRSNGVSRTSDKERRNHGSGIATVSATATAQEERHRNHGRGSSGRRLERHNHGSGRNTRVARAATIRTATTTTVLLFSLMVGILDSALANNTINSKPMTTESFKSLESSDVAIAATSFSQESIDSSNTGTSTTIAADNMNGDGFGTIFSSTGENDWTLRVGETHRVYLNTKGKLKFKVVSNDNNVNAAIYNIQGSCPALTGPKVMLQDDSAFEIPGRSFLFDYYNLYRGSTISVRLDQLKGTTFFYLLKGAKALADLKNKNSKNNDPQYWEHIAVEKRYVDTNTDARDSDLDFVVDGKEENDWYTLVYDNPYSRPRSSVDVETDLYLSTYNLKRYKPECDYMNPSYFSNTCQFLSDSSHCIIIEAFSKSGGSDGSITVRVEAMDTVQNESTLVPLIYWTTGGFHSYILEACVLVCSFSAYIIYRKNKKSSSKCGNDDAKEDLEEPLLVSQDENDLKQLEQAQPPMAHQHYAQAD